MWPIFYASLTSPPAREVTSTLRHPFAAWYPLWSNSTYTSHIRYIIRFGHHNSTRFLYPCENCLFLADPISVGRRPIYRGSKDLKSHEVVFNNHRRIASGRGGGAIAYWRWSRSMEHPKETTAPEIAAKRSETSLHIRTGCLQRGDEGRIFRRLQTRYASTGYNVAIGHGQQ